MSKSCRSRNMLQNKSSNAKIDVDTAENEPSNVCRSKHAIPTAENKFRYALAVFTASCSAGKIDIAIKLRDEVQQSRKNL